MTATKPKLDAKMTKPELTEQEVIELIREGTVEALKELSRVLEDDSNQTKT